MPEAIAGTALPEGRPGAADEVAQTLTKAAGGFERTAATAQRAVAQVPTWQGLAAVNFHNRCATYEEAAKAAALACDRAAASVRRYGSTYDEAYARIERLQAEAEHCLERLKDAERRAAEAAGREQAARERATAAALRSPLDGGVSLAEHAAAQAEADGAADDRRRYEAEAQAERTELERLQAEAAKEHERIREAGREAAVAVEAAAAEMPRVGLPAGASGREGTGAGLAAAASAFRLLGKPWSERLVNESKRAIEHSRRAGHPTFERPDKLANHHMRHGPMLGYRTAGEYQAGAQRLIAQGFEGPGPANPIGK